MSSNTQLPLSPFIGKKAQPRIITRSHGILRPNLMQDFSITPKLDLKVIEEFDNPVPGLIFQVAGESTGKFSIEESNQPLVAMALADVDPTRRTCSPSTSSPTSRAWTARSRAPCWPTAAS
jgi:hypothetical protein